MKTTEILNKEIAAIKSAGTKLDAMIQGTAVGVAEHYAQHSDTGLVNRLFNAMPKGSRRSALADWLLKFVSVSVNTDAASKKDSPFSHNKKGATDAEAGALVMWYDLKAEKPIDEIFDVMTALRGMLKKMEKSEKLDHYTPEADAALRLLATAVGINVSDVPTTLVNKVVVKVATENT